jgi:hypothetical protein
MANNIPGGNNNDVSDIVENADQKQVSYESFSKVLGEKKKMQSEVETMKTRLAEYEQAKLESEGNLKQALDNQKKLTEDANKRSIELASVVQEKIFKQKFYSEASKHGAYNPEAVLKMVNLDDVEFTKDFELVNENLLTTKIQDLAKKEPYLFKKDVQMPNDLAPRPGAPNSTTSLKSLTDEQLKQLI